MNFIFHQSAKTSSPILVPEIGLSLQVRVPGNATGGVLTAIETINAPGKGPPLHRHPEAEIFYVLEGHYLFEVDGHRFESFEGDVVTVPGGAVHAFVNVGNSPARQFNQILPALDAAEFFSGPFSFIFGVTMLTTSNDFSPAGTRSGITAETLRLRELSRRP